MKLRVWHIPQIPAKTDKDIFRVEVESVSEAISILNIIWNYDNFQFERKIKPDFSNISGLEYFDEKTKEWQEYEDEFGDDICTIIDKED